MVNCVLRTSAPAADVRQHWTGSTGMTYPGRPGKGRTGGKNMHVRIALSHPGHPTLGF